MSLTLRNVFDRVSGGADAVTRDGVTRFVNRAGVGGGLFDLAGNAAAGCAVSGFMNKFADGGDKVTWEQFRARGSKLLDFVAGEGKTTIDRLIEQALAMFDRTDRDKSGLVDMGELATAIQKTLADPNAPIKVPTLFQATAAESGAKIFLALTGTKGKIARADFESLARDIAVQTAVRRAA